jgi:hypothetical protein
LLCKEENSLLLYLEKENLNQEDRLKIFFSKAKKKQGSEWNQEGDGSGRKDGWIPQYNYLGLVEGGGGDLGTQTAEKRGAPQPQMRSTRGGIQEMAGNGGYLSR